MNQANVKQSAKTGKKNIFISYRVSDTAGETGRLVDSLKQHFYEDQIFMDIDKIEPGVDFTKVISNSLESCDVMLVIIGPNWIGRNSDGSTRISKTNDWVRLEVASALKRDIRVVPVLVDNAALPEADDLPEDLHPLLTRQTFEVSNKRWKYDTGQLVEFLKFVGIQPKPGPHQPLPVPPPTASRSNVGLWILSGVGLVAIIFIILALALGEENKPDPVPSPQPVVNGGGERRNPEPEPEPEPVANTSYDVSGIWEDANGQYYLNITQNGKKLTIQSYSPQGELTGEGNGYMEGKEFHANLNTALLGMVTLESTLSQDGYILKGKTIVTGNGASLSEPMTLTKRE